jgi:hypothetical protein
MHIVTTSSQIINCIPRANTLSVTLELRDEQSRVTTSKAITGTLNGNYVQYNLDFICTEGNYYTIILKDGTNTLYRGMVFCTNQTDLDAYKLTEGEYTSPSTNNEYIFNG